MTNPSPDLVYRRYVLNVGDTYLQEWAGAHDINLLSLTLLSMIAAENASKTQNFKGAEKWELTGHLVPVAIDIMTEKGYLDAERSQGIKNDLEDYGGMVGAFISLAVEIARDPRILQTTDPLLDFTIKLTKKNQGCMPWRKRSGSSLKKGVKSKKKNYEGSRSVTGSFLKEGSERTVGNTDQPLEVENELPDVLENPEVQPGIQLDSEDDYGEDDYGEDDGEDDYSGEE